MQCCFSDPFINTACKAEPTVISHFSTEGRYIKTRISRVQEKRLLLLNQTLQNKIHEVEFKKDSLTISLVCWGVFWVGFCLFFFTKKEGFKWKEAQLPEESGTC